MSDVSDRVEVKRLLREAANLPPDVTELPGSGGHRASFETSVRGNARKIVVSRDGVELCWMFTLKAGEMRPDFYPGDVPFLGKLPTVVMWDSEAGLSVKWMVPGYEDRIRALAQRVKEHGMAATPKEVTELAQRLVAASPEERKQHLAALKVEKGSPVMAWVLERFGDVSSVGLPEEAAKVIQNIVGFHVESGWTVLEGASSAADQRYEMRKGSALRHVYAISILGITTVDLHQRP